MARIRGEEAWARSILAKALGAEVTHHDTGVRRSMYDLEIRYSDGRVGAAEVVAAADGESIALWREMNDREDRRWQVPELVGGWGVGLFPHARAKRIRAELPRLLKRLENIRLRDLRFASEEEIGYAHQLGVSHAMQSGTNFPGRSTSRSISQTNVAVGWPPTTSVR